jgi:hypothetical protein
MSELKHYAMRRQLRAWHWSSTYSKARLCREVIGHDYIHNIFAVCLLIDLFNDAFLFP